MTKRLLWSGWFIIESSSEFTSIILSVTAVISLLSYKTVNVCDTEVHPSILLLYEIPYLGYLNKFCIHAYSWKMGNISES